MSQHVDPVFDAVGLFDEDYFLHFEETDVHLRHNTTFGLARRGEHWSKKPVIGDRVDIGTGAVVVGPVKVGPDSIVGANVVVLYDVGAGSNGAEQGSR